MKPSIGSAEVIFRVKWHTNILKNSPTNTPLQRTHLLPVVLVDLVVVHVGRAQFSSTDARNSIILLKSVKN